MADGRRRPRVVDLALLLVLATYALGALAVLAQGLLAVAASISSDLHETLHIEGLGTGPFSRVALRAADAAHDLQSGPQIVIDYIFSLVNVALAGLLLWLRPRDWTARLLAVALIGAAGVFNLTAQAVLEQLPLFPIENFLQTAAHVVTGLAYVYALLLFPDGRPVPRWPVVPLVALYLPATVAAVFLSVRVEGAARPAALLLFFGLLVPAAGAAAQAYRIRRTDNVTAQAQARLLFWALLPSVALGIVFLATNGLAPTTNVFVGRHIPEPPVALYRAFEPAFALIPFALFAGLLRFRLWDIERLVNRTVVYAGATTLLGGIYVAFVLVTQFALGSVAASPLIDSKPAVAITTLLLASAFRPLRARIQTFVDRYFNRSRYDAQLTVMEFAGSLTDEVELENIAAKLGRVVHKVVEPHHLSLWVIDETSTARTMTLHDRALER